MRVFIPSPAVNSAGDAYGGDDREQQYTGGTSRLDITVTVSLTTGAVSYQAAWGETTEYDWNDTVPVPDKPSWWLGKTPDAQPIDSERLQVTSDNVRVSASSGAGKTTVAISYNGVNPLSPVAHPIDGHFTVSFNADGSLTIRAMHDGFPAHTMYVNGALVYDYDPVARGRGPGALAGGMNEGSTVTLPHVPGGSQPDRAFAGGNAEDVGLEDDGETEDEAPGDALAADAPETTEYPIDVDRNGDGSVTMTVREGSGEFSETLTYDEESQWTGPAGSAVSGGPDLFDDTGGWSLIENTYGFVSLIKRPTRLTRR